MQGYRFYSDIVAPPIVGDPDEIAGHSLIEEFGRVVWNDRARDAERSARNERAAKEARQARTNIASRIRTLRRG
jgi:hypothetical protein